MLPLLIYTEERTNLFSKLDFLTHFVPNGTSQNGFAHIRPPYFMDKKFDKKLVNKHGTWVLKPAERA
jgi:hypothetical protein